MLPEENLFYEEIQYSEVSLIRSAHIFKLNQKSYILLESLSNMEIFIYDIDADKNVSYDKEKERE